MGNQLIKDTDIEKDPISVGGHCSLWKVYRGTRQDQSQTPVCIFLSDKKEYEKRFPNLKEEIAQFLRKEGQSLLKFKHPSILSILEQPLEDTKSFAFVTEPIQENCWNILTKNQIQKLICSELDLKLRVCELINILNYLNNNLKMVHCNLNPENLYLGINGKIKLGGFIFSTQILEQMGDTNNVSFSNNSLFSSYITPYPNLSYSAPELITLQGSSKCSFKSDVFALGLVILTFLRALNEKNFSKNIIDVNNQVNAYIAYMNEFPNNIERESYFQKLSPPLQNLLRKMLMKDVNSRPSIAEIQSSEWIQDPYVTAYNHLENITSMDNNLQIKFLQGFSKIFFNYDQQILKSRILNSLMSLFKFDHLINSIMILTIEMTKREGLLSQQEFYDKIWGHLKSIVLGKEIPAQTLWMLMENLELWFKTLKLSDFINLLMPVVIKCYDCPVAKLQVLGLSKIDFLFQKLDYQTFIKTKLLPRIINLCLNSNIEVRKEAILIFKNNLIPKGKIDQGTIKDHLYPALEKLRKMDNPPEITMLVLYIYSDTAKSFDANTISTIILPALMPYLVDEQMNKQQFREFIKTIKSLLSKVEEEKIKVLPDETITTNITVASQQPLNLTAQAQFNSITNTNSSVATNSINNNNQNTSQNTNLGTIDFEFLNLFTVSTNQTLQPTNQQQQVSQQTQPQQDTQNQNQVQKIILPKQQNEIKKLQVSDSQNSNNNSQNTTKLDEIQESINTAQQSLTETNNSNNSNLDFEFDNLDYKRKDIYSNPTTSIFNNTSSSSSNNNININQNDISNLQQQQQKSISTLQGQTQYQVKPVISIPQPITKQNPNIGQISHNNNSKQNDQIMDFFSQPTYNQSQQQKSGHDPIMDLFQKQQHSTVKASSSSQQTIKPPAQQQQTIKPQPSQYQQNINKNIIITQTNQQLPITQNNNDFDLL